MRHLLSLESLARPDMELLLESAAVMKKNRGKPGPQPLAGQVWALLFSKSSTRTRVSFEVGVQELGGWPMFLAASEMQLGRGEPIKDTARVLGRMVHGAVIRTYAQRDVEEFSAFAGIPTINALTDEEHPCQILSDIFTYQEMRGSIEGRIVVFIGDGACNVATSWIWAATKLGFDLRIAAPAGYQPAKPLLARTNGRVTCTPEIDKAVRGADILYTDVWVSMGKEVESNRRLASLAGYQLNASVVKQAKPGALVMHCLPAYRGNEIDEATFEANAETIFTQAENKLHMHKAIMAWATASAEV